MLVQAWEVEAHAEHARQKGYKVSLHKFSGSKHVEHLRMAPGHYKEVVRKIWAMVEA